MRRSRKASNSQGKGLDGETVMAMLLAEIDAAENQRRVARYFRSLKQEQISAKSGTTP